MQPSLLNQKVDVYRRVDGGRDALNNPTYGTPVTGSGWNLIYSQMPCKLAFLDKRIQFSRGGERVIPHGTMYYGKDFSVRQEDRIVTEGNIQYVITSVSAADRTSRVIDHMEAICELP